MLTRDSVGVRCGNPVAHISTCGGVLIEGSEVGIRAEFRLFVGWQMIEQQVVGLFPHGLILTMAVGVLRVEVAILTSLQLVCSAEQGHRQLSRDTEPSGLGSLP